MFDNNGLTLQIAKTIPPHNNNKIHVYENSNTVL